MEATTSSISARAARRRDMDRTHIAKYFAFEAPTPGQGDLVVELPADIASRAALYRELVQGLRFPGHLSFDWCTLSNCLSDFEWLTERRVVLKHNALPKLSELELWTYLDILAEAVVSCGPEEAHELVVVFSESARATLENVAMLSLFVDQSEGEDVFEEVLVRRHAAERFEFLSSPGLLLGVAAGDVIELLPKGRFRVVAHGGNVCVQSYLGAQAQDLEPDLHARLHAIGGRVDGRSPGVLVGTIPLVPTGFAAIERVMESFVKDHPPATWAYGNVHEDEDGKVPLAWWPPLVRERRVRRKK